MRPRTIRRAAAAALVIGAALTVATTPAASVDGERECIGTVVTDAKMFVGGPSGVDVAVSLPPGEVTFTVHTWDGYDARPAHTDQVGERAQVTLYGGGAVVASSGVTPDLEDGTTSASWSGSFGPVDAPAGVDRVVISHAPSDTGAPDSLWAEVNVCVLEPVPETTTTVEPTTTTTEATTTTTEATTTTSEAEVTPSTEATTTTIATTTTEETGVLSEETSTPTTAPPEELQQLPRTGATTDVLTLVGLGLLAAGAALMVLSRRPARA